MTLKVSLDFREGQNETVVEVDSIEIRPQGIKVNGSSSFAIEKEEEYWHVCDGEALGAPNMTGGEYGVILGQAK